MSRSIFNLFVSLIGASSLFTAALATSVAFAQTTAPVPPAAFPSTPAVAPAALAATQKAEVKPAGDNAMSGKVAYYGAKFHGRRTASGERFNANAMTMAHRTLPFGTLVRVTNVKTKKSVVVRVNDRGPSTPDRIGDLSRAAAVKIGLLKAGVAEVTLTEVGKRANAKKSTISK